MCLILSTLISCSPSKIEFDAQKYNYSKSFGIEKRINLDKSETADLENSDRINRFKKLATIGGIKTPIIEEIISDPVSSSQITGHIPVVRLVFDLKAFFDSDSDVPLPQAAAVLDLIATNMKLDVPDVTLTILGHTDSTGGMSHNMSLSARRSLHVMQMLVVRGLDPLQMTTVSIGPRQPIASNSTAEGRARNRRVEFYISASAAANLAVIQKREIDPRILEKPDEKLSQESDNQLVQVFQARPINVQGKERIGLLPVGKMALRQPKSPADAHLRPLSPPPPVSMRPIDPVFIAKLTDIVVD